MVSPSPPAAAPTRRRRRRLPRPRSSQKARAAKRCLPGRGGGGGGGGSPLALWCRGRRRCALFSSERAQRRMGGSDRRRRRARELRSRFRRPLHRHRLPRRPPPDRPRRVGQRPRRFHAIRGAAPPPHLRRRRRPDADAAGRRLRWQLRLRVRADRGGARSAARNARTSARAQPDGSFALAAVVATAGEYNPAVNFGRDASPPGPPTRLRVLAGRPQALKLIAPPAAATCGEACGRSSCSRWTRTATPYVARSSRPSCARRATTTTAAARRRRAAVPSLRGGERGAACGARAHGVAGRPVRAAALTLRLGARAAHRPSK